MEIDERHTVEEASETRQCAEYELIAATSVNINEPITGNTVTTVHKSYPQRV